MMRISYIGHVVHSVDMTLLSPVHRSHRIQFAGGNERPAYVQLFAHSETFFSLCVSVVQRHFDHQRSLGSMNKMQLFNVFKQYIDIVHYSIFYIQRYVGIYHTEVYIIIQN